VTVGLAEGALAEGWLAGVEVLLRLGADEGVATGCEALGDGSVVVAEGDPVGGRGTAPVGDGEGVGVARDTGARLGTG
jgi:hypothetical protein